MDSPGKSPRRELQLQGPRPTPLKINKDSHKIKKPPLPPPQSQSQSVSQPRLPVIIYTVSPKVIHVNPNDFKDLVQRLTGLPSSSSSSSGGGGDSSSYDHHRISGIGTGAISPAAHYATVAKANNNSSPEKIKKQQRLVGSMEWIDMNSKEVDVTPYSPAGILLPESTLMPPISSSYFAPSPQPADHSPLSSFFQDLSPILHQAAANGNRNFIESSGGTFMPSIPSNFISSPYNQLNTYPINLPNPDPNHPFFLDKDFFKNNPEFL